MKNLLNTIFPASAVPLFTEGKYMGEEKNKPVDYPKNPVIAHSIIPVERHKNFKDWWDFAVLKPGAHWEDENDVVLLKQLYL